MKAFLIILFLFALTVQSQTMFAKLDNNKIVTNVHVVDSAHASTELEGIEYLRNIHGQYTTWILTGYQDSIHKNTPGIGYSYDIIKNCFIAPRPTGSYSLNVNTCRWDTLK